MVSPAKTGLVAIGRNEGERLRRCLLSVLGQVEAIVYVDSGSDDGSVALARELGVEVVTLDMSKPFTAARARNSGFDRLLQLNPDLDYVQFVDGDCEVMEGWLAKGISFLDEHETVGVVTGRCRERFPEKTIYNLLCDMEWQTPVGEIEACGGNALMRVIGFDETGRFRDDLIAGEEPELCLRLRRGGWKIWHIDAEMVLHDAAMTRLDQWWRRAVRAGHAYAHVTWLYHREKEPFWRRSLLRILIWGGLLPLFLIVGAVLFSPLFLIGFLLYPLQIVRIALGRGPLKSENWLYALSTVLDKFPAMQGVMQFYARQLTRRPSQLIEYK